MDSGLVEKNHNFIKLLMQPSHWKIPYNNISNFIFIINTFINNIFFSV